MIACGMCDLSPGLNTPIRTECFSSHLGLYVTGTADDPLSVSYSTKGCRSHRIISLDTTDTFDDVTFEWVEGDVDPLKLGLTLTHDGEAGPKKQQHDSLSKEYTKISSDTTAQDDKRKLEDPLSNPPDQDTSTVKSKEQSIDWFKNDNKLKNKQCTPVPCTPAKKPKLTDCINNGLPVGHLSSDEKLGDTGGNKMVSDTQSSEPGLTYTKHPVSNEAMRPIARWRSYRHKVLLKLRKKQEGNNYDLALFLFIKFGGPETSAGRSVMRDKALLECSILNSCHTKEDFEEQYRKERAKLTQMLSQRIAVNALSAAQLNRKLAKLLPPNRWFNHARLLQKVTSQETWNPFSIFGSALPYVNIDEVFKQGHSKEIGKRTEAGEKQQNIIAKGINTVCDTGGMPQPTGLVAAKQQEHRVTTTETTPGINWSGDPLVLDEVLWYLEATGKYVDKSKQACVLQKCFCVTPNPQVAFNWNDSRNPAWKNYRGPRASMGQALSPSMYKESMMDYARLQGELEPTMDDIYEASVGCSSQSLNALESNREHTTSNRNLSGQLISAEQCSTTHSNGLADHGNQNSSFITPRNHHAKMQKLTYYRNYFKANSVVPES